MKFASLFIVSAAMASLVTAVPLTMAPNPNDHVKTNADGSKTPSIHVAAHLRRLISNMEETNGIPNEHIHVNRREAMVVENRVDFRSAGSYSLACGGAIAVATSAKVYGNIVTRGSFSTGDGAMVFGDVDSVGAASFGTNANFSGTVISQGAISIGAINRLPAAVFAGDIYSTGAVSVGPAVNVTGSVLSCSAFLPDAGSSVSGQVLVQVYALSVPLSNDTKVLDDAKAIYSDLMSKTGGEDLVPSMFFNNDTLSPGLYNQINAWVLPAGKTLTFNGTSTDQWIIQLGGAVAIAGDMKLIGGALPANIQWAVSGALSIGAGLTFYGNIVSQAAVALQAGATLYGSVLSPLAACAIGAAVTVTKF